MSLPWESTDTDESLSSVFLNRETDREPEVRKDPLELIRCSDGRTSFFCFEAGNISSRSTGTPRETRNSRRMGDRIQSGGWSGGGAASCDQSEALRGLKNIGLSFGGEGRGGSSSISGEYNAFKYGSVAVRISSKSRPSRSNIGCRQSAVSIGVGVVDSI